MLSSLTRFIQELRTARAHQLRISSISHITRNMFQVSRGVEAPQATNKKYMASQRLFLFLARLRECNWKEERMEEVLSMEVYSGHQKNAK